LRRHHAAHVSTRSFALNREKFECHLRAECGGIEGIDASFGGDIAQGLENRFHDARDAGAITGPIGVEPIVYALGDSLIVAVREEDLPRNLAFPSRQLATYSFEAKYVVDPRDGSFEEACAAVEELLIKASALLPSFAALRKGERARRLGLIRPICALRRYLCSSPG
jgi:hypothetical protein